MNQFRNTKDKLTNEKCWILVGTREGMLWECAMTNPTEGQPTQVDFDHDWVLDRDLSDGDIVGFLHTHPSGSLEPSQKDIDTLQAWVSCFGRPMLCLIAFEKNLEAYLFASDECEGRKLSLARFVDDENVIVSDRLLTSLD